MTPTPLPRLAAPLAAFAWLTRKSLFPGENTDATAGRWRSWLVMFLLPALWLYPTLGHQLLEPDEGRYAQIAREMHASGDWIVPTLQGQPYLDKPPLLYWLTTLSYMLFGVHASAARLVPAVAVHLTILACYQFGRRLVGEPAAFRGCVFTSLSAGFIGMGRLLVLDGLLTSAVVVGWLAGMQRQRNWAIVCITAALGTLVKGPIAVILILPPLVAVWSIWPERFFPIRSRDGLVLAISVLALNLPWYSAVIWRQPDFIGYFFWQHNLQRFLDPFDHIQPVWYYAPILLGGMLPASLFAWRAMRAMVTAEPAEAVRRTPELAALLLAGGWCVGFFTLSGCKLPTYILPAFPVLSMATAQLVGRLRRRDVGLISAWAALFAFAAFVGLPWYAEQRSPVRDPELIRRYLSDRTVPAVCYPRTVDSVAFFLGRDDLRNVRSKNTPELIQQMMRSRRTVVLFTHRHSLASLKAVLPGGLRVVEAASLRRTPRNILEKIVGEVPWGLCDIAVIERIGDSGD